MTLLRDVVAHGPDGSGLSVDAAARSGRRRVARRAGCRWWARRRRRRSWRRPSACSRGSSAGGPAGAGRRGDGRADAEPRAPPVRRLRRGHGRAGGLPVLDTGWAVQPYVRMGAPGEFRDFPGSRSLQTFGTPGSALDFQTVELDPAQVLSTEEDLCGAYLANGFGCTTSTPDEGLTLLRLLDRPEGPLVGVELWHPDGVVVVSRNGDTGGSARHRRAAARARPGPGAALVTAVRTPGAPTARPARAPRTTGATAACR